MRVYSPFAFVCAREGLYIVQHGPLRLQSRTRGMKNVDKYLLQERETCIFYQNYLKLEIRNVLCVETSYNKTTQKYRKNH